MNGKRWLIAAITCAVLPLLGIAAVSLGICTAATAAYSLGFLAVGTVYGLKDELLTVSKALSNGAGSVETDGIDLGHGTNESVTLSDFELEIVAPALTTTLLPNSETMKYIIEHDDDPAFGTVATVIDNALVQTGADGAGAAAATGRARLPSTCKRYIRMKVTKTGTGNASTVSGILRLVF
jgi:hypothetical protein